MEFQVQYPVIQQQSELQKTHAVQKMQWSTGICDCCSDMNVCLCGTFCMLCLHCLMAKDFGECICLPILPGSSVALRTAIRERYHIQGSICEDCAVHIFCFCCISCQMAREIKLHMKQPGPMQIVRTAVIDEQKQQHPQ
ncbi:cornifelin-like [Lethenteron reissneri]|uniref:cornifelin-like n=1 Tax=Lethenteron reissneri TaxID=7753 RepID=UPI002AB770FF|nr:cornifelin-like [Lethenteron reissneri]XP_061432892.1 cornifelin-like [Lethenteron reissneri]